MITSSHEEQRSNVARQEQWAEARRLTEAVQEQMLVVDADGTLLFANQHALEFFAGDRRGQDDKGWATGCRVVDVFPAEQAPTVLAALRRVAVDSVPLKQRLAINPGTGGRWFEMSLTPIPYGAPPHEAVLILLLDVTAQLAQQDSLHQSEEQYRALFASMQEGVIYFSAAHEILRANPAAERILGCSTAELQQRLLQGELWTPVDNEGGQTIREHDPITRCFAAGLPATGAMFFLSNPKTGRDIWIAANVTPQFQDCESAPYQVILTFNDVTDRIRQRQSRHAQLFLLENTHRWTLAQLLRHTLDKVGELTGSPIGFYHFVDEAKGLLSLQMWSSATLNRHCRIGGTSGAVYPVEKGGVWLDCLRRRTTVIHNDYASLPHKRGMPEGHAEIVRELVTPIVRGNAVVAILGVGNKARDYSEEDAALAQHFADLAWDLVEQKQIGEEQRESRRKLNALISNLPGMAFSVEGNEERTLHFVSDGCLELTGCSARELLAPPYGSLAGFIHPDDRDRVRATVAQALANNCSHEVEYRLQAADGRERIILERGVGVAGRSSNMVMIEGFATDITEQKNASERIAESHRQLLTILDSIEAQIFVADMETHQVLFVNRKMKELFGEGALSEPCYRVFQQQEQPCGFCTNDQLLDENGEPGPVRQWERLNPVTGRWYVNYDRAVRWLGGKIVRMQVAFDNTDRKESELKLRQMQKMEAIGLLAGGVAHDFNNILSVILGYATMALDELGESGSRVKRDVLQIQKAGLRARDLVKQILSFCHQSEEHFQPLKMQLIVKEVVKMLRSSFPSTIHIGAQISVIDNTVLADPSQIHQVLMNLCTNALHAMKEGGELEISLQQTRLDNEPRRRELQDLPAGCYLQLSVRDTGMGIPQEIVDKIFDPFFTTKGEGEGTGLGLAVVQGIVATHRGAITVDSRPGEGTVFAVYLPEFEQQAAEESGDPQQELPRGKETVLIVDDEPAVAMVLGRMLSRLGYGAEVFTDSSKAFEAYTRDPSLFDLVITDMTMPRFTGMAIARAMLALRPDQPIIICTGYTESIDEAGAKAEGVRDFLAKPVSQAILAKAVRRALDGDQATTAG
jgi:PAS domain S-box-containing protein